MSTASLSSRLDTPETTLRTLEPAQQTAAKVAGFAYLITFATVVYVNFGIHDRLLVENNAETARNILAHEQLFRIGIVGDLIYCAGVVVLLTALYIILKPVSRGLALLAAFWRLVWVLMWLVMTLNLFDALRLLSGADYSQALGAERVQALASLYLGTRFDYYYVGLLFGVIGIHSLRLPVVQVQSLLSPRALAALRLDLVRILRGSVDDKCGTQ